MKTRSFTYFLSDGNNSGRELDKNITKTCTGWQWTAGGVLLSSIKVHSLESQRVDVGDIGSDLSGKVAGVESALGKIASKSKKTVVIENTYKEVRNRETLWGRNGRGERREGESGNGSDGSEGAHCKKNVKGWIRWGLRELGS
jgi:hypothetical protein